MTEPRLKWAEIILLESGFDTSTAIMARNYDILYSEILDSILNTGKHIDVGGRDNVGDVSMHKHLSRFQSHNLISGNSWVSATDP